MAQPIIKVLPLTPLIAALRKVMQEGASPDLIIPELCIMSLWGGISFFLALRLFRWE
jgi:ABC-2 type transport system permease protein